jgi:hypothetical protein
MTIVKQELTKKQDEVLKDVSRRDKAMMRRALGFEYGAGAARLEQLGDVGLGNLVVQWQSGRVAE